MGLFDFWRRKRRVKRPVPSSAEVHQDLERMLERARKRLDELLPGRRAPLGLLARGKTWQLSKTNHGLYRLEGPELAVTLSTEPFLMKKDGKLQGLLHMTEQGLARALRQAQAPAFFQEARPVREGADLLAGLLNPPGAGTASARLDAIQLETVLTLQSLLLERWLARTGPALLAQVCVAAPPPVLARIRQHLSLRMQLMVTEELAALCRPVSERQDNPHARRWPLLENDRAVDQSLEYLRELLLREKMREAREARAVRGSS